MKLAGIFAAVFFWSATAHGQSGEINNLRHPPGYQTAPLGSLGPVIQAGRGDRALVIVPGLSLSADAYEALVARLGQDFKVYLPTPAGLGGSAAPPMPEDELEYGDRPWTRAYEQAVIDLAEDKGMRDAVIMGHFAGGAGSAMRIAKQRPDLFSQVVLLSGEFSRTTPEMADRAEAWAKSIATRLWKGISEDGWKDGMFKPATYSRDPATAQKFWDVSTQPPLPVAIRYTGEFFAADMTGFLDGYETPTLVLLPSFTPGSVNEYTEQFFVGGWENWVEPDHAAIRFKTIDNAHAILWVDNPEATYREISDFLGR